MEPLPSARNANGDFVTGFTGTVHFTSSDPFAVLPADYTFLPTDHGQREFPVRFNTVGNMTVTAQIVAQPAITTTSPGINVYTGNLSSIGLFNPYDMVHDPYRNIVYFFAGYAGTPNWDDSIIYRYDVAHQTLMSPWIINTSMYGDMEISPDGKYLYVLVPDPTHSPQSCVRRIEIDTGKESTLWYDGNAAQQMEALSDGSILMLRTPSTNQYPALLKITADGSQIVDAHIQVNRPPGLIDSQIMEVSPDGSTIVLQASRYNDTLYRYVFDTYVFHVGDSQTSVYQEMYSRSGRFPVSHSNDRIGLYGRMTPTSTYGNKLLDDNLNVVADPWPTGISMGSFAIADPLRDWFHTYNYSNGIVYDRILNQVDGSIVADIPIYDKWFSSPGDSWWGDGRFMVTEDGAHLFVNVSDINRMRVQIIDLPAYSPALASVSGGQANEGNTGTRTLDFVISLSQAKSTAQEVRFQTQDGSATRRHRLRSAHRLGHFSAW
ncbi:MAG: hypothetical protein QM703_22085 [Gemmatales bacterium]